MLRVTRSHHPRLCGACSGVTYVPVAMNNSARSQPGQRQPHRHLLSPTTTPWLKFHNTPRAMCVTCRLRTSCDAKDSVRSSGRRRGEARSAGNVAEMPEGHASIGEPSFEAASNFWIRDMRPINTPSVYFSHARRGFFGLHECRRVRARAVARPFPQCNENRVQCEVYCNTTVAPHAARVGCGTEACIN